MTDPTPSDYVKWFDGSKSHHKAFLQMALERLNKLDSKALKEGPLRELWLAAVETKAPAPRIISGQEGSFELRNFPYFYQTDNGPTGWRECQTSSIAMCLKYLNVKGINNDTDYLKIVNRYGDTTEQTAHIAALKWLNVRARFVQNATDEQMLAELKAGLPVAAGLVQNGYISNLDKRSGHWVTVYGATTQAWKVNDPFGELDMLNGGFARTGQYAGKGQLYSKQNFGRRWRAEGGASGWAWFFS